MLARAAALVFLFASVLDAQIVLGPERFACDPRFDAPFANDAASATNGVETLVVIQPSGVEGSLYAQRLDANAQPLTAHGTPIARGVRLLGGVASNHNGYVVFWVTEHAACSTNISATGDVSAPQLVAATDRALAWPHIATNGTDYLAIWTEITATTQQPMAVRLDSHGNPAGNPFPLTGLGISATIAAIASDGHDYLASVENFDGTTARSTLVPVSAGGAVGTRIELPMYVLSLLYTTNGFIALWNEPGMTKAMAVDASGHRGGEVVLSSDMLESASTNGADALAIVEAPFRTRHAIHIRRNGDAIEVIEQLPLMLPVLALNVAGALHTGAYFAMTVAGSEPVSVALVKSPANGGHPLLTFATPQQSPAISGDVVAWHEGPLLWAARLHAGTTLDPAGIQIALMTFDPTGNQIAGFPSAYTLASNGGRTLIVWSEQHQAGEAGGLMPIVLQGRMLAQDGTLSPPFTITSVGLDGNDSIGLGGATTAPNGFVVVWSQRDAMRRAVIDANGNVVNIVALDLPSGFFKPAIAPRADGFLLVGTDSAKYDLVAAPFRADGTAAGPRQVISTNGFAPDVASDGHGHFLAVWATDKLWSQALDENGAPAGAARPLGNGNGAHVAWSGSTFVVVSGADVALVTRDGRLLVPLVPLLPPHAAQTVVSAGTIAYVRSGIDDGVGDENVVFVRSFTPARRRAMRP